MYGYYVAKNKDQVMAILQRRSIRTSIFIVGSLLLIADALLSSILVHRLYIYIYAAILMLFYISKIIIRSESKYHFVIPCLFFIYLCHKIIYLIINSFLWTGGIKRCFLLYFLDPLLAFVIAICLYYVLKKIAPMFLGVLIGGRNV